MISNYEKCCFVGTYDLLLSPKRNEKLFFIEISAIKEKLSINHVLDHYGLKPNRNKMLCCPFHPDKKPSMQVYPETNTVHCFSGNCEHTGKAIDQIDFIMHKEQLTKHEAILKAKKLLGETIIESVITKHKPMNGLNQIFKKLKKSMPLTERSNAAQYLKKEGLPMWIKSAGMMGRVIKA